MNCLRVCVFDITLAGAMMMIERIRMFMTRVIMACHWVIERSPADDKHQHGN
ncbi:hypothetical protein [uncultured Roseibium sp.]|uniref:hypothetical protein n=1 Tax=uncultured Roseibium sp. TaxID=1936171 RepID=UPI00261B0EE4|nr:hypothetical protein [uncultured Roseibium sp.]